VSTIKVDTITDTSGNSSPIIKGAVLQVQYTQYTSTTSVSLTADTNAEISVLTVNITPKSTSSIIKLDTHVFHEWSHQDVYGNHVWFFYRDTTKLAIAQAGSRLCGISASTLSYDYDIGSTPEIIYYSYFDAPNTTSQITYKVGVLPRYSRTLYVNRTVTDNDNNGHDRGLSFISATEIAG
jgi:hypothetical protein